MPATVIMALAIGLYVLHRWAKNQPAVTLPVIISGLFAVFVIALLDQGRTESIAKGFAWLFLAGSLYNVIPDISKASSAYAQKLQAGKPPSVPGTFT